MYSHKHLNFTRVPDELWRALHYKQVSQGGMIVLFLELIVSLECNNWDCRISPLATQPCYRSPPARNAMLLFVQDLLMSVISRESVHRRSAGFADKFLSLARYSPRAEILSAAFATGECLSIAVILVLKLSGSFV